MLEVVSTRLTESLKANRKKTTLIAIIAGIVVLLILGFLIVNSDRITIKVVNETGRELKPMSLEIGDTTLVVPALVKDQDYPLKISKGTISGCEIRLVYNDASGAIQDEFVLKGEEAGWFKEVQIVVTDVTAKDVMEVNVIKVK